NQPVIFSLIPWAKRLDWTSRERRQQRPARCSRGERDISLTNRAEALDVAMVIVDLDYDVLDLLLQTDTQTFSERRLKRAIDICWEQLRRYRCMRKRAKRSSEKEAGRFTNSRGCLQ